MIATLLLPILLGQSRIESQRFEWGDPDDLFALDITTAQSNGEARVALDFSRAGENRWSRNFSVTKTTGEPVGVSAYHSESGIQDRLFVIELRRVGWKTAMCVLATPSAGYDASHTFQGSRTDFVNLDRARSGNVNGLTFYDPWVGGISKKHYIDGLELSRWERVDERILSSDGIALKSRRYRLVPAQGGGRLESKFAWRSDWAAK